MKPLPWILTLPLLTGLGALPSLAPGAGPSRANVVFIVVDDLNDWIGCMKGHPQARTPHIDRLAGRGVLFTNAHCAAPVCLASRTAVFSGRAPLQTGVYSNWGKTQGKPPAKALQLTSKLTASGYETWGAGKLYHGHEPKLFTDSLKTEQRWSPFSHEQARYLPEELPTKGTTKPRHQVKAGPGGRDWVLPLNGLPSERNADNREGESFDWGPLDVADAEMGDCRATDWALAKLGTAPGKPFFLGVGYYRPHIPLFAPARDFAELPPVEAIQTPICPADDLADLGPVARQFTLDPITAGTHRLVAESGQWRQAVRAYLACVSFVDRQIGRLLDGLDASPAAGQTWIVLWSDHGWQLGEKEHWGKWTGWRQSTRVPLIVVPPPGWDGAVAGRVCDEPVSLLDLHPTVLEVCGLAAEPGLAGRSLLPLIRAPQQETDRAVLTSIDPGNYALSNRDWRFIRYHDGTEELYQISQDPGEWRNLAGQPGHEPKLAEMRARLEKEIARHTQP